MAAFQFEACDASGARQNGVLDAPSSAAAAGTLRERGWVVLSLRDGTTAVSQGAAFEKISLLYWLPVRKVDVEVSLQQIASMLRSGMTLLAAIKTAAEQSQRSSMARVWTAVSDRIQEGGTLADALKQFPSVFPDFVVQLVNVGEASGTLDVVLGRAAEQIERSRTLKMTLINALLYPLIVFVMAVAVTSYMLISLIPKLQKFLAGRNKKLPVMTQMLLDLSAWTQAYLPYIVAGFVAFIAVILITRRTPSGRLFQDRVLLRLPIIGRILRTAATAAFARTLGMLLQSGLTLVTALQVAGRMMSNRAISIHVNEVRESVMAGGTLAAPLTQRRLFMPMLGRVAAVGEATGSLDAVLAETSAFHEKQLAATVRWLSVIIEPVIIVVVGGIVGFVYIAFFTALYSIAS